MQNILVFCGANAGRDAKYAALARKLGIALAERGYRLVYGGGKVGLMGAMADAALEADGEVIGIIPHFLQTREVGHAELTELVLVDSMHDRKIRMAERSDAVIVLPGGYGTLDELFEMLTLNQLGQHRHPIGLLNSGGFYDHLLRHLDHLVAEQFLKPAHRQLLFARPDIDSLLSALEAFEPPSTTGKWIRL